MYQVEVDGAVYAGVSVLMADLVERVDITQPTRWKLKDWRCTKSVRIVSLDDKIDLDAASLR